MEQVREVVPADLEVDRSEIDGAVKLDRTDRDGAGIVQAEINFAAEKPDPRGAAGRIFVEEQAPGCASSAKPSSKKIDALPAVDEPRKVRVTPLIAPLPWPPLTLMKALPALAVSSK